MILKARQPVLGNCHDDGGMMMGFTIPRLIDDRSIAGQMGLWDPVKGMEIESWSGGYCVLIFGILLSEVDLRSMFALVLLNPMKYCRAFERRTLQICQSPRAPWRSQHTAISNNNGVQFWLG